LKNARTQEHKNTGEFDVAEQEQPKKVIIDEDWKNKVEKEKDSLETQEKRQETKAPPELPEVDFTGLVGFFATQAYFALGLLRDKKDADKKIEPDLEMARYNIDILALLEEKCKGNLTADEQQMLQSTLGQLRMLFVSFSKK
jgi:hypothetical protein